MHTKVGIIVDALPDTDRALSTAENLLQKYDLNFEVKPYKDYPDKSYVRQLLRNYKFQSLEALAKSDVDWKNGEEGGIDAKGLFFISTQNPDGRYDAYSFLDGPITVAPNILTQCGDIITPDGALHNGPITFKDNWLNRKRKLATWNRTLQKLAETHSEKSLVIFVCHS